MEKLKYIKIEDEEGNLSENIPLGVDMENVDINLSGKSSNLADYININNTNINNLQNQDIELDEKINTNTNNLQSKINNLDEKSNSIHNNLESQIKGLASGSPLAANSIEEMTDTTRIYVNITDGHWYYYNGNSWADGGVYQATEIADESIGPEKTKFYNKSINIRDVDTELIGKGINSITGEIYDNEVFVCSDFIKINNAETIGFTVVPDTYDTTTVSFAFYDNSKNFILYKDISVPTNEESMAIPSNAEYVRYAINRGATNKTINITMPYTYNSLNYIKPYYLEDFDQQLNNIKNGSTLEDEAIEPRKTTFFDLIINLIDKTKFVQGAVVGDHGILDTSFQNYNTTDYIKIKKDEEYFLSDNEEEILQFVGCFYNTNGKYLHNFNDTNPFTVEEDGYCRLSIPNNISIEKIQLQSGKITEYVDYDNPIATLKKELLPYLDNYILKKELSSYLDNYILKKELLSYLDNYISYDYYKNKKVLILGDSITALDMDSTGWVKYFSDIVKPNLKMNVAVSGATWRDKMENQIYDGNPQPSTDGNVIGNQVQKVINEKNSNNNNYENFDVIIIAAGTNDTSIEEIDTVENEFISEYWTENYTVVPLENVNRQTFAGAMRYAYEKLNELYPNAKIIVCTPLQECFESFDSIYKKGKLIEYIASRLSIICWNLRDCGILNIYEKPNEDCRDLIDGIHPNASGAKKIGEYISREFKKLFI